MRLAGCAGRVGRLALVAAALAASAAPAAAVTATADPATNLPVGEFPHTCSAAPSGVSCETAAIARLDAGRAKLGLGPYRLPGGFIAQRPERQLLILANLDRIAYSLRPIAGLSLTLDAVARQGALARQDPNPEPTLAALRGQNRLGFASNWAGGAPNALVAYFVWMYDDGYGSGNLDCTSPSAAGCWGHRHTILAFAAGPALTMGAAAVPAEQSYALTVVVTSTPPWPYSYTWGAAKADGAGR